MNERLAEIVTKLNNTFLSFLQYYKFLESKFEKVNLKGINLLKLYGQTLVVVSVDSVGFNL